MATQPGTYTPAAMTPSASPALVNAPMTRPVGVTIVAVLQLLGGGLLAILALFAFLGGAVIRRIVQQYSATASEIASTAAVVIGILILVFAAVAVVVAIGNLNGKGWAWGITLVLTGLALLLNLINLIGGRNIATTLVAIAIQGAVVWYYLTPPVKAFFHRPMNA